ncbi:tRNA uridine(34) hydroxylas [Buchnera aphidicola (Periphyllus testudinaceus)]|uniref:oxygen-dependent tRNA uridine(34) hydroxylase TrhO n=1 Tax=Buchnera aphidicola TaxID=9 RepID=UPI003463BB03
MPNIVNFIHDKNFKKKNVNDYIRINFSFYKYFYIKNLIKIKNKIENLCKKLKIFGRIYISYEGINVQGSILKKFFNIMKNKINKLDINLKNVYFNIGIDNTRQSFFKLKVKIKKNLVSDKIKINFLKNKYKKKYLNSKQVNNFLDNEKVIFIDVRNNYEYKIGHFKKAISLNSSTFKNQLKNICYNANLYKKNKIVLYCTGGIRCEKTAFLMNENGYKKVYQIYGGIIGYVNDCIKNNNPIRFLGKNFVFDFRLKETISKDILSTCYQCRKKSDHYVNCMNEKCNLLFIQCIFCSKLYKSFCSKMCYIKKKVF